VLREDLTVANEFAGDLVVLFLHQPQVKSSPIANLIVCVVETPSQ